MLTLIYSSGLRVSEITNIKTDDIIRNKMLLRIRQAKGNKDRYTILSEIALKALEKYWRAYHPAEWFFPGVHKTNQISIRACQHAFEIAKKNAGIMKKGGIHILRHSFATHYLEVGGGLFQLQKFLGHKQIRTTLRYVHLAEEKIIARSPLDVYVQKYSK
jgi:site-specific recombinase XerD